MSKVNAVQEFITTNHLNDKVTLADNGTFNVPLGLFEETVLTPLNITPEQHTQLNDQTQLFNASLITVGGELAGEHFKANPESFELGLNYDNGAATHNSVFGRKQNEIEASVVTEILYKDSAEHIATAQAAVLDIFNNLDN